MVSFCVAGYTTLSILQYNTSLINGTGSYLQVLPSYITLVNVSTGCDVPILPSRRRLHTLSPPPPPGICSSSNSSSACVNGTSPLVYNASNSVTYTLSLDPTAAANPAVQSRILALGNTSSVGASAASAVLVSRLRGAGLAAATGGALSSSTAMSLEAKANASAANLAKVTAALTNHTDFNAVAAKLLSKKQSAEVAAGALAALAVLWIAVHALMHAVTTYHLRRTTVTAALLVQCELSAGVWAELASRTGTEPPDEEDATDEPPVDPAPGGDTLGKRFRALVTGLRLQQLLTTAAAAAMASPAGVRCVLRPLNRGPLLAARSAANVQDASGLALKSKPQGVLRRLKRALLTEMRWQGKELVQVGRTLRRCCTGSRAKGDVGRVFRLVPAQTDAMRVAAKSADSPAASLAASLMAGPPNAVLVEIIWFFGARGRNAACVWRHALRSEETCSQLEASIAAALTAEAASIEIQRCSLVAVALLDDAPHAALDKKRATKHLKEAIDVDDTPAEARSTGLAPAVAARLGAVLVLARAGKEEAAAQQPLSSIVVAAPTGGVESDHPEPAMT